MKKPLKSGNDNTALLVLRGETTVYERYFQGHIETSLSQAFSMAKSFTRRRQGSPWQTVISRTWTSLRSRGLSRYDLRRGC